MPVPNWILDLSGEKRRKALTAYAEYEAAKATTRVAYEKSLREVEESYALAKKAARMAFDRARQDARRDLEVIKESA